MNEYQNKNKSKLQTCVSPDGHFIVRIHQPSFEVINLRQGRYKEELGQLEDGTPVYNDINFPISNVSQLKADQIYEVNNAFPFRGATFINSAWANSKVGNPQSVNLPQNRACSFFRNMKKQGLSPTEREQILLNLPDPLKLALADSSTDPEDLEFLARSCCTILFDQNTKRPSGIRFKTSNKGRPVPDIKDHELFEIIVNNPFLPDDYKNALVLKPGIQGNSEIMGEYGLPDQKSHVFEYLRRNSYIPWGHFASNMANDAVRYKASDLTIEDMKGIRHLFYQRIYIRVAQQLGIDIAVKNQSLSPEQLEQLRNKILLTLEKKNGNDLFCNGVLWGWNFGFGAAQSGYRLHASHQMIHQQNGMIPALISDNYGNQSKCFAIGDLVADFIEEFRRVHNIRFFDAYIAAIRNNTRIDSLTYNPNNRQKILEKSLIIFEDENVILFVPKAQINDFQLQLLSKKKCGNILMADISMRASLDYGILKAVQIIEKLGSRMITGIEISDRIGKTNSDMHLVYDFIPKLPYAPRTFSETQLRWITGIYPEDFAHACRIAMKEKDQSII